MKYYVEAVLKSRREGYTILFTETFGTIDEAHHAARKGTNNGFIPVEYAVYEDERRKSPIFEMISTPDGWQTIA